MARLLLLLLTFTSVSAERAETLQRRLQPSLATASLKTGSAGGLEPESSEAAMKASEVAAQPVLDYLQNLSSADPHPPECLDEAGKWSPGRFLGSGAYGDAWLVRRAGDGREFALKQNQPGRSTEEIEKEVEIMKALDEMGCPHVIELEDDAPCGGDEGWPIFASYVMPLMRGDLQGWAAVAAPEVRQSCAARVARQVASGLSCLHEAGWIHMDLRPQNIFYRGEDEHGCPDDIAVADFGIAVDIDHFFDNDVEIEGSDSDDSELDETLADWCSYFYMMKLEFGYDPKPAELPNNLPSGSCGNPGRVQGSKVMICRVPEGCILKDVEVKSL